MSTFRAVTGLALGLVVACASPAAAENVLRWASVAGAVTFDPHSANSGPDIIQQYSVYERLWLQAPASQSCPNSRCLAAGGADDLGVRAAAKRFVFTTARASLPKTSVQP